MKIIGRSSSHYTRVARMFAHELGVDYELVVVRDLTSTDPASYDNPALKIPVLRDGDATVFGTENICRTLAGSRWIETPAGLRNAQEFVWHAMQAQVQLVMGTMIGKLPADNIYFEKIRRGFEGALGWLEANIPPQEPTLLAITLYCLVEHIAFRGPLTLEPYPNLAAFARDFGQRPSAVATAYRFD